MVTDIQQAIKEIAQARRVSRQIDILNADDPCTAGEIVVSAAVSTTHQLAYSFKKLVSRAYHDALFMSQICPSGMIFVPSQNGYSHRPEEYTSPQDIARGVTVLAHTLARLAS